MPPVCLHHLQLWPTLLYTRITGNQLFWLAYAHPATRLPVFTMGLAAGLLVLRQEDNLNLKRNLLHCLLPWGVQAPSQALTLAQEEREALWRSRVDLGTVFLVAFVVMTATQHSQSWGLEQYVTNL